MNNWIHKSLTKTSIKDFKSQIMTKSPTSIIKNLTLSDEMEMIESPNSPSRPVTVVAINAKKENNYATGRERIYLSGCTNRRRDKTFKIVSDGLGTIDHSRNNSPKEL